MCIFYCWVALFACSALLKLIKKHFFLYGHAGAACGADFTRSLLQIWCFYELAQSLNNFTNHIFSKRENFPKNCDVNMEYVKTICFSSIITPSTGKVKIKSSDLKTLIKSTLSVAKSVHFVR